MKHKVYKCSDNWCFSSVVIRDFGANMIIRRRDGTSVLAVVVPLKCDPSGCGLDCFNLAEAIQSENLQHSDVVAARGME